MYCILLFLITSIHSKSSEDLTPISNISPASGYSSLTQSLGEKKCFNPVLFAPISGFTTSIVYDYYLSFNDLIDRLKIKINFDFFLSQSKLYQYLRYNQDDLFSLSFNYLKKGSSYIAMRYDPKEYSRMDESYFKRCGDTFVFSYEVGIELIYSIKINFNSPKDKHTFVKIIEKTPIVAQSFYSIANEIESIMKENDIHFTIEISGIQIGGKSKLINDNSSTEIPFKNIKCKEENLEPCNKEIYNMSNYMINEIKNQIPFNPSNEDIYSMAPLSDFALGIKIYSFKNEEKINSLKNEMLILYIKLYTYERYLSKLKTTYIRNLDDFSFLSDKINSILKGLLRDYDTLSSNSLEISNTIERGNDLLLSIEKFLQYFKEETWIIMFFADDTCLPPKRDGTSFKWDNNSTPTIRIFKYQNLFVNSINYKMNTDSSFDCGMLAYYSGKPEDIEFFCKYTYFNFYFSFKKSYTKFICNETSFEIHKEYNNKFIISHKENKFSFY